MANEQHIPEVFAPDGQAILSTAQILHPYQTFRFRGREIVLHQVPGVCGSNYYIEFGAAVFPQAIAELRRRNNQLVSAVEFGVGKGVYLTLLSTLPSLKRLWGSDVNPRAVALTKENLRRNGARHFRIRQETVERALARRWKTDLITFDLPLLPLVSRRRIPLPLRSILAGAGKTGRKFFDLVIRGASSHLENSGGIFFVQPSFIKGGVKATQALMRQQGLAPILLKQKKKYLDETILTQNLRPQIERATGQQFSKDKRGYFFHLQAVLGIKRDR